MQGKETSLIWVRDLFVHKHIKFIQAQFNKEMKLKSRPSRIKIKSSSWFKSRSLSQDNYQRIRFSLKTELRKKLSQDSVQD
jgi:hypothetical protein